MSTLMSRIIAAKVKAMLAEAYKREDRARQGQPSTKGDDER